MDILTTRGVANSLHFGRGVGEIPGIAFAVARSGKLVAATYADGTVRVWDTGRGRQQFSFRLPVCADKYLAFSHDEQQLYVCGSNKQLACVDLTSGERTWEVTDENSAWTTLAVSPDGEQLAAGNASGKVCLLKAKTGEVTETLGSHDRRVGLLAFSANSQLLASCTFDGEIKWWQLADQTCLHTITQLPTKDSRIRGLVFAPDGQTLTTLYTDPKIYTYDVSTGKPVSGVFDYGGVTDVEGFGFTPDGKHAYLYDGSRDRLRVVVWNAETKEQLADQQVFATSATNYLNHGAGVGDRPRLTVVLNDDSLVSVDLSSLVAVEERQAAETRQSEPIFSPPSVKATSTASTLTSDPQPISGVTHWSLETKRPRGAAFGVSMSSDGRWIATAEASGAVRIWNAESGDLAKIMLGHSGNVYHCSFSADGQTVASAGTDGVVRLWDRASGRLVRALDHAHTFVGDPIKSPGRLNHADYRISHASVACYSYQGDLLATGGSRGVIRLWDARTGDWLFDLRDPRHAAQHNTDLAWTRVGDRIATCDFGDVIRIWHLPTRRVALRIKTDQGAVNRLAWSADGKRLAAAQSKAITIWDTATGKQVKEFAITEFSGASCLAWDPAGDWIASGKGSEVRIWDYETGAIRHKISLASYVTDLSAVGDTLIAVATGEVTCIAIATGEVRWSQRGSRGIARSLAWDPDGKSLFLGGYHGLHEWDATNKTVKQRNKYGATHTLALAPDGQQLATSAPWQKHITLRDVTDDSLVRKIPIVEQGGITATAWSADGKRLVCAAKDKRLRTVDPTNGSVLATSPPLPFVPIAIGWDRSGRITASGEHQFQAWDPAAADGPLQPSRDIRSLLSFSPNGVYGLCTRRYTPLGLSIGPPNENGKTVNFEATATWHQHPPWDPTWSTDGKTLATFGRWWGNLVLTDCDTYSQLAIITPRVEDLAWSPSPTLAAACSDDAVRFYDQQGTPQGALLAHGDGQLVYLDNSGEIHGTVGEDVVVVIRTTRGQAFTSIEDFQKRFGINLIHEKTREIKETSARRQSSPLIEGEATNVTSTLRDPE